MDYAGLGERNSYPVDRPLTAAERATHYQQEDTSGVEPNDFLSVIRLNSTFIELVDRWYPVRGFWAWMALFSGIFCAAMCILVTYYFFISPPKLATIGPVEQAMGAGLILFFATIVTFGVAYPFKWEFLRWTHYPIRLNRKTRKVHVFRQNGTILTVPWDGLYIVRGEAKNPIAGTTYDLRAHVLDADGETVRESFSLGYTIPGDQKSIDKFWAFLQPYMEAADGVEQTHRLLKKHKFLLPLDGRKEGWRWSVMRSFMMLAHWRWLQLLLCVPFGLNAVGRMLAMWTSKQPKWPAEVESANVFDPEDTYQLDWHQNPPLNFWEFYWPLICTILGVGAFVGIIGWMLSTLWR